MKRINFLIILFFLLFQNKSVLATDTSNINNKIINIIENQILNHLQKNVGFVCNIDLSATNSFFNQGPTSDNCPSTEFVEQSQTTAINSSCYFKTYDAVAGLVLPKEALNPAQTTNEFFGSVAPYSQNFDIEYLNNLYKDLNEVEYIKKHSEIHLILINEVPISLIHYLGDKNNFDDLYINFSKNKGGNISEGDGQTLSEALALINNLTQKAIENVKAKIRADTDGSLRLPKLKFYVSETIHKTLMGDEFNVEQHSYYSFAAKQNDVTLSTNTTSKVSFKDIFNRVRIRYYKEGNFNENSFDLRKWLILMPTILKETYKQYDLLVNAATIFENWQPYEDLYNYISTNTTLIVNTGDIQGPLYGSQNNSQETEWFGQPINSANTKYNSWQNLKNLPEETFLLLDQEKALKILYILSAHISSAAIRNSSQQTTVNSYELDDEFQETVINLFKYFNRSPDLQEAVYSKLLLNNPLNNKQALLYDIYHRLSDNNSDGSNNLLNYIIQITKLSTRSAITDKYITSSSNGQNENKIYTIVYSSANRPGFNNITADDFGTSEIEEVNFYKDGNLSYKEKILNNFTLLSPSSSDIMMSVYYRYAGYELSPIYSTEDHPLTNALQLVKLIDHKSLGYGFEPEIDLTSGNFTVPLIALKYSHDRDINDKTAFALRVALDVAAIVSIPFSAGLSVTTLASRLLVVSVWTGAAQGGFDLISEVPGIPEDVKRICVELRTISGEISKYTIIGNLFIGGIQATQQGLVKLANRLEDLNSLRPKVIELHEKINNLEKNIGRITNTDTKSVVQRYLKDLVLLEKQTSSALNKALGANNWMNAEISMSSGGEFSFYFKNNTWLKVEKKILPTDPDFTYKLLSTDGNSVGAILASETNGTITIKNVSTNVVEAIPENAKSIKILRHNSGEKHINSKLVETSDDVVIARNAQNKIFICEGKVENNVLVHYNCFTKGTPVAIQKGFKSIENIQKGDIVKSYNETNNKDILSKVTGISKKIVDKLIRVITSAKDTIICTPDHPFYTKTKKWVLAKKLNSKIKLAALAGSFVGIQQITALDSTATVYNFEVENSHTYLVSNSKLIVHNNCGNTFENGFNVLSNLSDFNSLKNELIRVDNIIKLNKDLDKFLGLGFSFFNNAPANLSDIIKHPNFYNYITGNANAPLSLLKDFNECLQTAQDVNIASNLSAFNLEARLKTYPSSANPALDVKNLSPSLLHELFKSRTLGYAPNNALLPAYRSAQNILPYFAKLNNNGQVIDIIFNEERAKLLTQLNTSEYNKALQFKSIDMVEKCTIEQLKEILDDSRLFGIAKSIDAIQIAQGCLFEQQIITILKNEWGTFSKIGINNCSNVFKNLLTKLKNQWGTSFEDLRNYKLNTQISLKVTGGNWVTDILLTNKIPGTNNINAYVAECKLNATTLNSQRQNEGILQHQTNPNQPFENRSDAANRKTKINVMSDDLEVGSLLTIKSRAKVNLVGQNHEVTSLNPNN